MSIRIRRARPSDKRAIMEFVKDIWRGHDYIPYVWDEWMDDRGGRMFVAEIEGRAVAMNRIRFLEDGSGWLEGVRVHPRHRRKGLATLLGKNSVRFGRSRGVGTFKLTSASTNKAAHGSVVKMGFAELARMNIYSPSKGKRFRPSRGVRQAKADELAQVWGRVKNSEEYSLGGGVYWDGFTAISLTPETLAKRVRGGSVYLVGDGIAIAQRGGEGTEAWRQVCFATGPEKDVAKLVKYVFGRKERFRTTRRVAYAPPRSPLVKSLSRVGLARGHTFLLFQFESAKS